MKVKGYDDRGNPIWVSDDYQEKKEVKVEPKEVKAIKVSDKKIKE